MEIPKYVLDSTVIINHINKQLDIEAFFDTLPAFDRFISDITNIEALSKPGMGKAEIDEAKGFLLQFESVALWPKIIEDAAALRRRFRLKTPDASNQRFAIAATARVLGATLLTGDGPFANKKIPDLSITFIPSPPTKAPWWKTFAKNRSFWIAIGCQTISTLVFAILFILAIAI
jgi:predicted nucleic acid-binding protein